MSDREKANLLLSKIPDYKIEVVLAYLQGGYDASVEIPNEETIAAFKEIEEGGGKTFDTVDELFENIAGAFS